jgi:hypothetical protein
MKHLLMILLLLPMMPVFHGTEAADADSPEAVRFFPVEVWGDAGTNRLAAYQVSLECVSEEVMIIGIEGGSHPAFEDPPSYDPRAIQGNRLIAAKFSLKQESELPTGMIRLFTVHLQAPRDAEPEFMLNVMAAGGPGGGRIPLQCSLALPPTDHQ